MTNLAVPAPGDSYALYRHFDAEDRLLYVGISGSLHIRQSIHRSVSMWRSFIARTAVEPFDDPDELIKAERAAIETERPLFNVRHAAPGAEARRRAYLMENGYADLMRHWPPLPEESTRIRCGLGWPSFDQRTLDDNKNRRPAA